MARTGPVTRDTSAVALGLAQVRIGDSLANIASTLSVLADTKSIGALASTKFMGNTEYWKMESGFPKLEDIVIPIRESAALECAFQEVTPFNMALANGLAPISGETSLYPNNHSGEIPLGGKVAPEYVRMEAVYTYPNGTNTMAIIFPRAQVSTSMEMDLQAEDAVAVPITFEAKRADSLVSGGHAVWNSKPLGVIRFG
jgi:hypothetical protein